MARGGLAIAIFAAVIVALLFVSAAQSFAKKYSGDRPAAGNLVSLLDGKAATPQNQRGVGLLGAAANRQIMIALHDGWATNP